MPGLFFGPRHFLQCYGNFFKQQCRQAIGSAVYYVNNYWGLLDKYSFANYSGKRWAGRTFF